jgi:nicotinamidase-related amidase
MEMTSLAIRDQAKDHLLTPKNAALLIIDYQPIQVNTVVSMDRQELVNNIVAVAKLGLTYGLPIVFTAVNVKTGLNKPPIVQLRRLLGNLPLYDRTAINAWEDVEFNQAVKATGRKKLIMTALWTEVCLAFPALDAMREGYEAYPVVDAVGGTSVEAHRAGLRRIEQAGAKPISWPSLACELQRDWNRKETVPAFVDTFIETGGTAGLQFTNDKDEAATAKSA